MFKNNYNFNYLLTHEGEKLGNDIPWNEYPRPLLKRDSFLNLNGFWKFKVQSKCKIPSSYDMKILVPFAPESLLSGICKHFDESSWLFYEKSIQLPSDFFKDRILLNIEAADYTTLIWIDGKAVKRHDGGSLHFSCDITDYFIDNPYETHTITIGINDNLSDLSHPYGKQTLSRGGMWYTPFSGLQTTWIESVNDEYIEHILSRYHNETVYIDTFDSNFNGTVFLHLDNEVKRYPLNDGKAVIKLQNPKLWSPESPYLYHYSIELDSGDTISSYFAARTIGTKKINGAMRTLLNNRPVFLHALLDQGYYSDGLNLAASPRCMENDILKMKKLGFNTLRRHISIAPDLYYYYCDTHGMLVIQDMLNNGDYSFFRDTLIPGITEKAHIKKSDSCMHKDNETRKTFVKTMLKTVDQLRNFPCIYMWTIFNEGWGQFESSKMYDLLKKYDKGSNRLIDSASGWFRGGKSDVDSYHVYGHHFHFKKSDKIIMMSEFGGTVYKIKEHSFNPNRTYGYGSKPKTRKQFARLIYNLYKHEVFPYIQDGLCGTIYTQLSDVEDETNGLLTYDRRITKVLSAEMVPISSYIQKLMTKACDKL